MANDAGIGAVSSILQLLNAQNQQTQAQDTRPVSYTHLTLPTKA